MHLLFVWRKLFLSSLFLLVLNAIQSKVKFRVHVALFSCETEKSSILLIKDHVQP